MAIHPLIVLSQNLLVLNSFNSAHHHPQSHIIVSSTLLTRSIEGAYSTNRFIPHHITTSSHLPLPTSGYLHCDPRTGERDRISASYIPRLVHPPHLSPSPANFSRLPFPLPLHGIHSHTGDVESPIFSPIRSTLPLNFLKREIRHTRLHIYLHTVHRRPRDLLYICTVV